MKLKPYPKYKDSGIQWIGEIPEEWGVRRLKFEETVIMGQSPDSESYNYEYKGYPFLQGNAEFSGVHPSPSIWCDAANKYALKNDILLSVRAPIGAINIADQKYGIGRGLCAIRVKIDNLKYIFYQLLTCVDYLNSIGTGSTYTAISTEDIMNLTMRYPPIPNQTAIANFLDKRTTKIDALIEKNEMLIKLLKEKRIALINHAVTKGLNPNAKMKDSGVEWIGEIPEGWEVVPLGFLIRTIVPMRDKPKELEGEIPWIRIEDFEGKYIEKSKSEQGVTKETINEMNLKVFPTGTVLCSCSCNMGKTAIVKKPLISNQTFIGLLPNKKLSSDYLFYLIISSEGYLNGVSVGAIQQYFSQDEFKQLRVSLPLKTEQTAIANFLDKATSRIDKTIQKIEKKINLLEEYKKSLIHHTVTGKVDVREIKA